MMERQSDYSEKREKQLGFFSKSISYFIRTFNHYVIFRMPVFFISGLIYGHSLVKHAVLTVLILYITYDWENPNMAKAAIIMNAQEGLSSLLVLFEAHIADSSLAGRFYVIIFSTASMIAGLMVLREYDPTRNIGILAGVIFLIALGEAGKEPTLKAFLADQLKDEDTKDHQFTDQLTQGDMENEEEITIHLDTTEMQKKDNSNESSKTESTNGEFVPTSSGKSPEEKLLGDRVDTWWRVFSVLGALSGTFGLPQVPWKQNLWWNRTLLTTAIVMASSLLIFLSGFCFYKYPKPKHSPMKSVFRVLRRNKQVLAEDVKEVKRLIRMVPMWATFIMYCVTQATGSTFFFEHMTDLDMTIGSTTNSYTVPAMVFYLMQRFSSLSVNFLANNVVSKWFQGDYKKMIAYKIRIGLGLACSCLACVAAMFVEKERLKRENEHTGSDQRAIDMDMSVFYLTPQFCLLGLAEGLTEDGLVDFFYYQVAESSKNYGPFFNQFALGLGKFFSIFWILTFSGWINETVNSSELDKYYMVLALVNFGNLVVVYTFVSIYVYKHVEGVEQSWYRFFETCFERSKTAEDGARMSKIGTEECGEGKGGPPDSDIQGCSCFSLCPDH